MAPEGVSLYFTRRKLVSADEIWKRRTLEHRHPEADAYFIGCAQIKSVEVVDELEREFGKPVITSNAAAFRHSLRLSGIEYRGIRAIARPSLNHRRRK